ncbi:MAG TPA: thymidine phosphorylase, partial [Acidimicrobiaceae bacterium]|nr:thymidine phosphorylase [Acidimicrobiaceae bacterium]
MLPQEIVRAKRDGRELSAEQIGEFVAGIVSGAVSEGQAAAFAMATYFKGMTRAEAVALTLAMRDSGTVLRWDDMPGPVVDKHSTGGVGDTVSLMLAPMVAACGGYVPMISGRGLGHTGGTLDKLESIPGFRVDLDTARFARQVDELGVCLIGQTARVAPADKRLYALRDVTGTIESIPLIASSIMSKKLAEGIDGLVLDCKVGTGAFMKDTDRARALCAAIRAIGHAADKRVTCVLTDMDAPIGKAVGNALEIAESIDVLSGGGPADTRELKI